PRHRPGGSGGRVAQPGRDRPAGYGGVRRADRPRGRRAPRAGLALPPPSPPPDDPDAIIERGGLTAKRRTRTHALSGGQKRRLDVALGIVGRPELLFLDEPTTGFAPEARREFLAL